MTSNAPGPKLCLLPLRRLILSSYSRMSSNCSDEFFQATNHAEQTFRKMETYLQHKQLCDVLLIAGDHKIPAHRLVFSQSDQNFTPRAPNCRFNKFARGKKGGIFTLSVVQFFKRLIHICSTSLLLCFAA